MLSHCLVGSSLPFSNISTVILADCVYEYLDIYNKCINKQDCEESAVDLKDSDHSLTIV